jgi:hypothetical protein
MIYVSVNAWVKRYKDFGIEGLQTQPGRGRKRILDKETDKESILKSVKAHHQRIQTAKAEWEKESGRSVSLSTLRVFKSLDGRYKRIRLLCKGKPDPNFYAFKIELIANLEQLAQQGLIDLFYGDDVGFPFLVQFKNIHNLSALIMYLLLLGLSVA